MLDDGCLKIDVVNKRIRTTVSTDHISLSEFLNDVWMWVFTIGAYIWFCEKDQKREKKEEKDGKRKKVQKKDKEREQRERDREREREREQRERERKGKGKSVCI
jgi:hypothetical protein